MTILIANMEVFTYLYTAKHQREINTFFTHLKKAGYVPTHFLPENKCNNLV